MSPSNEKNPTPSPKTVFEGELGDIHLASILQMIGTSGKTGVVQLSNGETKGSICVQDGTVTHAEVSGLDGEEAFYELIVSWKIGQFSFLAITPSSRRTIHQGMAGLLLEAAQREDEWKILSKVIPSTQCIPICKDWDEVTKVTANPQEKALLYTLDGRRSIEQIARSLDSGTFELCKALYGLLLTGRVTLVDKDPP